MIANGPQIRYFLIGFGPQIRYPGPAYPRDHLFQGFDAISREKREQLEGGPKQMRHRNTELLKL
jgi:hypothetical protein